MAAVVRVDGIPPSRRQGAVRGLAGVVIPAVAQVAERSIRVAEPDGGRRQIYQHAETAFALFQLVFRAGVLDGGPGTVGDFADEDQFLMRPVAGPFVLNPEDRR